MKSILTLAAATLIAAPAFASEVDEATEMKIMAMLTEMECQMDADDIEVEDDGYDLDDVICKGGNQFDIKLDKDLNEVSRRAE
ncbi:PepSY domain-containing protein [Dinoroseobacter sp. S76]|uniref:PepSY domain-containing protein n=1 Tax=Dinoroseobacter sp. S76 TaxID=3415124 RepID=UPI003C7D7931